MILFGLKVTLFIPKVNKNRVLFESTILFLCVLTVCFL